MIFNSLDNLKSYILSKSYSALQKTTEQVYQIINRFVKEYYAEFSPEMYERTYQLFCSLVKSSVVSTGNGWQAYVYFDASQLDYAMKRINGREIHNRGWSEEKTLSSAAHGLHGGYASGTAIWDEPLTLLNTLKVS